MLIYAFELTYGIFLRACLIEDGMYVYQYIFTVVVVKTPRGLAHFLDMFVSCHVTSRDP